MTNEPVASPAEPRNEPSEPREPREPRPAPADTSGPAGDGGSNGGESTGTDAGTRPPGAPRRRRRGGRGRGRGGGGGGRPASQDQDGDGDSGDSGDAPDRSTRSTRSDHGDDDGGSAAPKRAPAPTRRPRAVASASASSEDAGDASDAPGRSRSGDGPRAGGTETTEGGTSTTTSAARRRRRRGGRGRRRPGQAASGPATTPEAADAAEEAGLSRPSSRRAQQDDALPDEPSEGDGDSAAPTRTRSRSRGGSRSGSGTRTRSRTRTADADGDSDSDGEGKSRPVSTRRMKAEPIRGRGRTRRRDVPRPVRRRTDKRMVITEVDDRDQIAVLEGRDLVEHYITRAGARSMVGNIYAGRVQNVLPGMEAAFIDIGRGRNGVLYAGEVNYDEEVEGGGKATRIEEALKSGQKVLVQVTKDPLGGKGARLTAQVSLPGRFLVFVPNQQVFGISRRLPEDERARLRDILKPLRSGSNGIIARTAAEGASAEDLEADLKRLEAEWSEVEKLVKKAKPPSVIYEEPELTVRVVRDVFTEGEFEEVVTDSRNVFDKVTDYLRSVAPELVEKVRLHEGPLPVMEEFHVSEQVRKALDRKVWLESGGYLIIDRTEAMTVIDVNTGKHVGKTNLEETVTQTNIEAAEEIARQLRLRDIGGMIIIDFIDMLLEKNRGKVIRAVKSALANDRTRSQVFDISPLGLLEVTRKKVSAGLVESFSETCPTCEGRGILLTHQT